MVVKSPKNEDSRSRTNSTNLLQSDSELKGMLKRLEKIKKYKTFNRWKAKFVDKLLGKLVFQKGIDEAEKACNDFDKTLRGTIKCASKVTGFIESGELSKEKKTVKSSLAMNELTQNFLLNTVESLTELIPSMGRDEKRLGYTKFHLGAALIRQGFTQYITMKQIEDALDAIGERIGDFADKQQMELLQAYKTRLQRFCDIMADLNLYEVMMKCVEFAEAPGEEESSDEEPMNIQIEVETPEGKKVIHLEVEPSDKIIDIKNIIADDIGIEPARQVVRYQGTALPDDSTLGKAGIHDGSILTVEPLKVPVTVKTYDGKQFELMVDPFAHYISDIKNMIEPKSGIPAMNQALFLGEDPLENNNSLANECGVEAGTVLYVEPKYMKVNVEMPDGTKHEVEVCPSDTTEQVKDKIEAQTGMEAPQQILKFKGQELAPGKKLKDSGVRDGDDLQVESAKVPVNVETKNGETIQIMVSPVDTLGDIRKMLEDETGLSPDLQILSMNGKELDGDDKTAGSLGIKAGSTLKLKPKQMEITVTMPDGTKHTIEIDAMDKSSDIAGKIDGTGLAGVMAAGSSGNVEIDIGKVFGK